MHVFSEKVKTSLVILTRINQNIESFFSRFSSTTSEDGESANSRRSHQLKEPSRPAHFEVPNQAVRCLKERQVQDLESLDGDSSLVTLRSQRGPSCCAKIKC